MRKPPKWTEFLHYPVISSTALLAVAVTVAWWAQVDISRLFETAMIRRGELWRLATSIFPHVGIVHLAFNIYWLWVFGTLVEQVYGGAKTIALIALFGIGPNALEYAFSGSAVGLSGVGYGLFGLLWVLSKRDERFHVAIDTKTIQLFVAWFFLCIFLTYVNFMNIGNIAHGAGAVLGILTGWAITLPERRPLMVGLATVVVVFGLWAATLGRPRVNLAKTGGYEECHLGTVALKANQNEEAARWLRESVGYRNIPSGCWANLGLAYQRLNRNSDAVMVYRKAADMGDDFGEYNLGAMYEHGTGGMPKDTQQALNWYRKAADHGLPLALNNVAWAYATSTDPAIHNPGAALKYATQAVAADKEHPDPAFLDTLAEAQYANGLYQDAVKTELQAITLAPQEQKGPLQKSLAKYQLAANGNKRASSQHM